MHQIYRKNLRLKNDLCQLIHYHFGLGDFQQWSSPSNLAKKEDIEKLAVKIIDFMKTNKKDLI